MKIDHNGWEYYDKLPVEFSLAKIDDFHVKGTLKLGMEFLIKWADKEYFQVCKVSSNLKGSFIKPFIDCNRVFLKTESI